MLFEMIHILWYSMILRRIQECHHSRVNSPLHNKIVKNVPYFKDNSNLLIFYESIPHQIKSIDDCFWFKPINIILFGILASCGCFFLISFLIHFWKVYVKNQFLNFRSFLRSVFSRTNHSISDYFQYKL